MTHYYFDWDPTKAVANFRKHGVSFDEAAAVFRDPAALSLFDRDIATPKKIAG